jgi:phosphopantothenate-cysteine ligase
MSSVGLYGMFYLAAAVSDFYVPWESMVGFYSRKFVAGIILSCFTTK